MGFWRDAGKPEMSDRGPTQNPTTDSELLKILARVETIDANNTRVGPEDFGGSAYDWKTGALTKATGALLYDSVFANDPRSISMTFVQGTPDGALNTSVSSSPHHAVVIVTLGDTHLGGLEYTDGSVPFEFAPWKCTQKIDRIALQRVREHSLLLPASSTQEMRAAGLMCRWRFGVAWQRQPIHVLGMHEVR